MDLLMTNIPADAKNDELYDHIVSKVSNWWVKGVDPEITRCEIFRITDQDTNDRNFFALVSINTEEMAERVINKLNGKKFKASRIGIREYAHRAPVDQRYKDDQLGIIRLQDRRRKNLKIERQKRIIEGVHPLAF